MGHESRNLFLNGPDGRLEAIFWRPEGNVAPPMAAVVCHPHPLFGGTMHNKVAYQAAKSLDALGLAVLRFNFRGTGMSAGTHDRGRGERGDVTAALDFLAAEFLETPLLVAGFSFGCFVGLRVGCKDEVLTIKDKDKLIDEVRAKRSETSRTEPKIKSVLPPISKILPPMNDRGRRLETHTFE